MKIMNLFSKIMIFFLLIGQISLSAQSNKKNKKESLIYKPEKTFLFQADYDSAGIKKTNYIVMRILNKEQYGGRAITYDYYDFLPSIQNMDSLSQISETGYIETTQILDEGKRYWVHPPRSEYYPPRSKELSPRSYYDGLTQYFPFPYISLPVKPGKKYKDRYISFNDPICNCNLWMKYSVKNLGFTQYKYKNQLITATIIDGNSKSKIGNYSFRYLFNEELGFVNWKYNCDNIVFLELNLIDVF
jgi:hypothetical protein